MTVSLTWTEAPAFWDAALSMRLALLAEELRMRFPYSIWLCGSALIKADPEDWDVRVVVPNHIFDETSYAVWCQRTIAVGQELSWRYGIKVDLRVLPRRLWYEVCALRLTAYRVVRESDVVQGAFGPQLVEQSKAFIAGQRENPELHIMLGALLFQRGDRQTATQAFLRAIQLDPNSASAWLNLGNVYYAVGDFRKAALHYRRAIQLKPDYAKAYVNMANTLTHLGVHASAVPFYDRAIQLDKDCAAAHQNKANCLTYLKRYVDANRELGLALQLDPVDAKMLNTLGNLRAAENNDYAAAAAYRVAIALAPSYAPLYTNLANIMSNFGWMSEAILNYERGLVLEPKNPGVRYNLALAYLRTGRWREGWRAYESRWEFRELATKKREFTAPQWRGEDLAGRRILVHAEQGLGDTIQFCRYLPMVARRGGIVYFEVQHGLQRLMASLDGVRQVCTRGLDLPEFDVHCPLLSMPAIFKTDAASVPAQVPYLRAWDWQVRQARQCWPGAGLRVGLSWAGNPKYKRDKDRSFSLCEFTPLADLPDVRFFSLQKGPPARQIDKYKETIAVIDASSRASDFAESAALASTLDLVITSDSSPAHMAAAIGCEVWLLLCYLPDWRWGDAGEQTPWYPNVRIFRQTSPGDWAGVMTRVRDALQVKLDAMRGIVHERLTV